MVPAVTLFIIWRKPKNRRGKKLAKPLVPAALQRWETN